MVGKSSHSFRPTPKPTRVASHPSCVQWTFDLISGCGAAMLHTLDAPIRDRPWVPGCLALGGDLTHGFGAVRGPLRPSSKRTRICSMTTGGCYDCGGSARAQHLDGGKCTFLFYGGTSAALIFSGASRRQMCLGAAGLRASLTHNGTCSGCSAFEPACKTVIFIYPDRHIRLSSPSHSSTHTVIFIYQGRHIHASAIRPSSAATHRPEQSSYS